VQGRLIARGNGFANPLICDGTPHIYSADVYPSETPFDARRAAVLAFVADDLDRAPALDEEEQ
jgi:hypothetical protein